MIMIWSRRREQPCPVCGEPDTHRMDCPVEDDSPHEPASWAYFTYLTRSEEGDMPRFKRVVAFIWYRLTGRF